MSRDSQNSSPHDAEVNAIEAAAAEWMIRRDSGLSAAEERALAHWLGADRRHEEIFAALAVTWQLLAEVRPASSAAEARQVARRGGWWLAPALATAAAVTVAWVGWWGPLQAERRDPAAPFALAASTEVGALRTVELPDGSVMRLNTDSAVDVRFDVAERRVRLARGEAHFTVARNSQRPFIVSVAGVDVRVVGTVFNVRLRSESVDVLVTEGKVRVGSAAETASTTTGNPPAAPLSELTAGQKVSIALPSRVAPTATVPVAVPPAEVRQALAWQARRLDFDSTPLSEIVAEFNRYNRHKLVIIDGRLSGQRYGGSFPAGDGETFVRMLESNFGVTAERSGEETKLRLKTDR